VRRLIGSNYNKSHRKISDKAAKEAKTVQEKHEVEDLDPSSIEAITARLLKGEISESEEAEYEWYIEQPQALLTASGLSTDRKDVELYASGVAIAQDSDFQMDGLPDKAYIAYIQRGQPDENAMSNITMGSTASHGSGPGGFSYERWVASGTRRVTSDLFQFPTGSSTS